MKKLIMNLVQLVTITSKCWTSNSVWIKQDNKDTDGSTYIKKDDSGNKVGIRTSSTFNLSGNNLTLIIKQIGNSNLVTDSNHKSFKGEDMTFDYTATGNSNILRVDLDDVGAEGHYYDIDITGGSNIVEIDTVTSDDVKLTNVDLDIVGDSNDFWMYSRGDGHFIYVLMSGDSNDVEFYSHPTLSEGMNTNSNKAIGPQVASHGQFADTSGSEGATIDVYIVGSSNQVHMESWGTGNYQVHDVIGSSNILDVHPDVTGSHVRMVQRGNNNYMKTVTSGNSNVFRYYGNGGSNTAYVYIYTSEAVVELKQLNGSNTANLTISGDSIYDFSLLVDQDGSDSCTYSYNRNNQTEDTTIQLTNSGC